MDNKIEEVKKILLQPTVQTDKPIMGDFPAGQLARQICRLFEQSPQYDISVSSLTAEPDEGMNIPEGTGLREKMTLIMSQCYTRGGSACKLHPVFQPQKATAVILQTFTEEVIPLIEKQARKELIEEIVNKAHKHTEDFGGQKIIGFYAEEWQALKEEYLGSS